MRYARRVDFNIKSGQEKEFTKVFESKVVPMLQKQKGFQDELVLTAGHQVTAISIWDTRLNAESYDKTAYPKVLESIKPLIEGNPKMQPCDVTYMTHHAVV